MSLIYFPVQKLKDEFKNLNKAKNLLAVVTNITNSKNNTQSFNIPDKHLEDLVKKMAIAKDYQGNNEESF